MIAVNECSRLRLLVEAAQDIILFLNEEGRIIEANQKAVDTYGYSTDELLNMTVLDIRHASTHPDYEGQMSTSLEEGIVFESLHVTRDGNIFPVEVSSRSLLINGRIMRINIIRDISDRKEAEARIRYLAEFDALTGLENRARIIERLDNTWADSQSSPASFAVMVIDLDKFKHINDRYGHLAGDMVLQEAARRFLRAMRKNDYIGRYGGDEFLVVQKNTAGKKDIQALITRIFSEFEPPYHIGDRRIRSHLSIGISVYPHDGRKQDELIRFADQAMYAAKKIGGNSYCFYDSL